MFNDIKYTILIISNIYHHLLVLKLRRIKTMTNIQLLFVCVFLNYLSLSFNLRFLELLLSDTHKIKLH